MTPEQRQIVLAKRREYERRWITNNREKYLQIQRKSDARPERKARKLELRRANPKRSREIQARYRRKHPERVRRRVFATNLRKSYGMTTEDYARLMLRQNCVCAICGNPNKDKRGRGLHVDHDHRTKTVRGLLCSNCNKALGCFGDDPLILIRAIKYLATYRDPSARIDEGKGEQASSGDQATEF